MNGKPNPYKIPPKFVVIEANEEIPVNYRENCLFWCLGALTAFVLSLALYETEIYERLQLNRLPASVQGQDSVSTASLLFSPFENLPSLY